MTNNYLGSLPTELLSAILSHLPIADTLAFAATSRPNQEIGYQSIRCLNLAVLPRRIHCELALAHEHGCNRFLFGPSHERLNSSISKATNISPISSNEKHPKVFLDKQVEAQNSAALDILKKSSVRHLRSLTLHMYDLQSTELSSVIGRNLPSLQNLELNFNHPFVHDPSLPSNYWRETPEGSPCWNALSGLGGDNDDLLRLRNLRSLKIERSSLTSTQLRRLVESNPRLRTLSLRNVAGVDLSFVNWFAMRCESTHSALHTVKLEDCVQLQMQCMEDFAWLAGITESNVRQLSLWKCRNVRHQMLVELIENGEDEGFELGLLEKFVPPRGPARRFGEIVHKPSEHLRNFTLEAGSGVGMRPTYDLSAKIEVDPDYMTAGLVVGA